MKILIYGDSNTWGDNFYTKERIEDDKQWPNMLQKKLDCIVYQEGLPGRIAGDYEVKKYKNGKDSFISTFKTKAPLDIVIISLGTNDLQIKYNRTLEELYDDLMWYKNEIGNISNDEDDCKKLLNNKLPKLFYILHVNFDYEGEAKIIFDNSRESIRKKLQLKMKDENVIILENANLFDDGIHLSYLGHQQMFETVYEVIYNDRFKRNKTS